MVPALAGFLAKATGPSRLRSELRMKTRALGRMLRSVGAVGAVRTDLPESLLGGDILALMSTSLRRLLQGQEQPETAVGALFQGRSRFAAAPGSAVDPKRAEFSTGPIEIGGIEQRFSSLKPAPRNSAPFLTPAARADREARVDPFLPPEVYGTARAEMQTGAVPARNLSPGIPAAEDMYGAARGKRRAASSVLVERLREYWCLCQEEQMSARASREAIAMVAGQGRGAVTSPPPPPALPPPRSWPEIAAWQAARKLYALASGGSRFGPAGRVQQKIKSDLPEKVEIQNIFNVEVKGEKDLSGSIADLSEKIADILREQAIEHGIDIT